MNLLISSDSNPYTNLAIEEFLLKNSNEDFVFLYVNRPSVVIGKHQIAQKEINSRYAFENEILIARRLSGGGTVFHDEGNLNFSFIQTNSPGVNISYKILSQPIIEFLQNIGADVHLSERNDIMISDKKVSGSAMHIFKNRVLAHCTLLIDCNLNKLSNSLLSASERFKDKSIASVRSKVMNLSEVSKNFTVPTIIAQFTEYSLQKKDSIYSIPANYTIDIQQLATEKYSSNEWIYGYSPKYQYKNSLNVDGKRITYALEIEKGIIKNAIIESKNDINSSIELEINALIGRPHNLSLLKSLTVPLSATDFQRYLIHSLF